MCNKSLAFLLLAGLIGCPFVAAADDFNPAGVIVDSLPELTLNTLGIMPTTNPSLWAETPTAVLIDLIRQVGQTDLSPAERQFVVQLLSLDVTGTQFNDAEGKLGESGFLKERLQALFNMGEWENVLKLIDLIPETDISDDILKIKVNTLLLKGDTQNACTLIEEKESELDTAYVDKMRIACFLAKEEKEKAVLAFDIYQEKTGDTESLFAILGENALHEIPTSLPKNAILSPEDIYLAALNKNPNIDWSKQLRAIKMTLADLPTTNIPLRIALAEQSGLPLEAMKKIYRLPLFDSDLKDENNRSVKRASLYQKIMQSVDNKQKSVLIHEWIDLIKKDGLFIRLAPIIADIFHTMNATDEQIDLSFAAVQIYGLENNLSMAEPWFDVLQRGESPTYQRQRFLLAPLWQNLGGGLPSDLEKRMNRYCGTKPIEACAMIQMFVNPEFYNHQEMINAVPDITDNPNEKRSSADIPEQAKTTRLGEFLLQAVLSIHNGKDLVKSYSFVQEVGQKESRDALMREGMIFE